MQRWKSFTMVALFVAALGLAGCGGGGNGTTDTPVTPDSPPPTAAARIQAAQGKAETAATNARTSATTAAGLDHADSGAVAAAIASAEAAASAAETASDLADDATDPNAAEALAAQAEAEADKASTALGTAQIASTAETQRLVTASMMAAATKSAETKEMAISTEAGQGPDQSPANPDAGLGGSANLGDDSATGTDDDPYSLSITRDRDGTEVKITDSAMNDDDDPKFMQAMDLGGGTTMHLRQQKADDDGNVVEEVVVVSTNIEPPKPTAFAKVPGQELTERDLDTAVDADEDGDATNDFTALTVAAGADNANLPKIMSTAFPAATGNTVTHSFAFDDASTEDKDEADERPGVYNGAMGTYRCNSDDAACTVTVNGKGEITAISDGWVFTPDKDATSYVSDPDYNHYGFWLKKTKDKDGAVTYNEVETFEGSSVAASGSVASVRGNATYDGGAVGVYVHDVTNPNGTRKQATAGHFTADVNLTATFAQTTADDDEGAGSIAPNLLNRLKGTIDNFELSGGEMNSWSVTLSSSAESTDGTHTGTAKGGSGNGSFNATFYGPTGDDGTTQPSSIVGEFNAGFSNGSVAGAFGATKQ